MSDNHILKAEKRNVVGKKVKHLRKKGLLVANVFGKDKKSQALQLPIGDFRKVFKIAGGSTVIKLLIDGEKESRPVLVANTQYHPVSGDLLHVDFHQVDLKQKVTANVSIDFIGESPAKSTGAILVKVNREVEIEALPNDMPKSITVDLSVLKEIGSMITAKDLKLSSNVSLVSGEDMVLVKAELPKKAQSEGVSGSSGEGSGEEIEEIGKESNDSEEKKEE